jgi:hypothetical protein
VLKEPTCASVPLDLQRTFFGLPDLRQRVIVGGDCGVSIAVVERIRPKAGQ